MVAIVSGNSLGLLDGSAALPGQRGLIGTAANGKTGEGAYLNIASGNLVLQDRDDFLAAHEINLASTRTYNAQGNLSDGNGVNWKMGLLRQVTGLTGAVNTAGSTVTRIEGDGSQSAYTYDATRGGYVSTDGAGAYNTLRFDSTAALWTWTHGSDGTAERYDAAHNGRLVSVIATGCADPRINTFSYQYDGAGRLGSIVDGFDESVSFDYTGNNLTQIRSTINTIHDWLSDGGHRDVTRVRYAYDAQNRLTGVTTDLSPDDNSISDGNIYTTRYGYDGSSNRIASVTQQDGTQLTMAYTQAGGTWKIASLTDGMGRTTRLDYSSGSTTVTDPLGYRTVYAYDAQGQLTGVTGPAIDGVSQQTSYQYDSKGNITRLVDPRGNAVDMAYDANGNQTLRRDAIGNTVTRTYDSVSNKLLTETTYLTPDPDGSGSARPGQPQTTRYVYDSYGKLRFQMSPEGGVTEYYYNGWAGELCQEIKYTGIAYDTSALAATDSPTERQVNDWAQAAFFDAQEMIYYDRDLHGMTSEIFRAGSLHPKWWNPWFDPVYSDQESDKYFVYDQTGKVLQIYDSNLNITNFAYDGLGRLLATTDARNNVTLTQYDDTNNRAVTTLANGLATTSVYDKAGELISVIQSDPNGVELGKTSYAYDAGGRLRMTTGPTGQRSYLLYDAAGRKTADIDAGGRLTETRYNADNQVTETIRYASAVTIAQLADGRGPQDH